MSIGNTFVIDFCIKITLVNTIGQRIAERRAELNLTQKQLAISAGFKSSGTIGNYEAMTRGQPRDLLSLAKALRVNPEWLVSGKGAKEIAIEQIGSQNLSPLDRELLTLFNQIEDDGIKNRVIGYVESVVEKQKNMRNPLPSTNTKKAANGKG